MPVLIIGQIHNEPSLLAELGNPYSHLKILPKQVETYKTASFIGKCVGFDFYAAGTVPGSYVLVVKADFNYDTTGNMVRGLRFNYNGSGWTPSSKDTLVYDANGNIIKREILLYNGGMWTPLQKLEYQYNALNQEI